MLKYLFSTIALSSLLVGSVQAQSDVTMFGLIDLGVSYKNAGNGKVASLESGMSGASRLGFKGTEIITNDLKANFLLEMKIGADNGSSDSQLFNRSAWVGLSGDFGNVNVGNHRSLSYIYGSKIDLFGEGLYGKVDFFHKNNYMRNNSITYISNEYQHFTFAAQYGLGEVDGNVNANSVKSLMGSYAKDQLVLTLIVDSVKDANGNTAPNGKKWLFGGTYQFRPVKLHAMLSRSKGRNNPLLSLEEDKELMMIGVLSKKAANTFLINVTKEKNLTYKNANSSRIALGYLHDLSLRTSLYTSFALVKNDANVKLMADKEGAKATLFNMGMRHKF